MKPLVKLFRLSKNILSNKNHKKQKTIIVCIVLIYIYLSSSEKLHFKRLTIHRLYRFFIIYVQLILNSNFSKLLRFFFKSSVYSNLCMLQVDLYTFLIEVTKDFLQCMIQRRKKRKPVCLLFFFVVYKSSHIRNRFLACLGPVTHEYTKNVLCLLRGTMLLVISPMN